VKKRSTAIQTEETDKNEKYTSPVTSNRYSSYLRENTVCNRYKEHPVIAVKDNNQHFLRQSQVTKKNTVRANGGAFEC
jgi:hypothetical protein